MTSERSIEDINQKIKNGTATILTAKEIQEMLQNGEQVNFEDVDVVTTATKGLMSGTSLLLGFRISEPKIFKKLKSITLNGITAYPGPAPNETLGVVDLTIYGTEHSNNNPKYGGGHLFRDLVEGKPIKIHAESIEGVMIDTEICLNEMKFAQLLGSRHAFKNYNAFVNPSKDMVQSIFSVKGMAPDLQEASFCGVGTYNPLENDPTLQTIGIGTPISVNGARGYVLHHGTRSSTQRPNIMTLASLFEMKPEFMGGFQTSHGPEVICSIAIPIPIVNDSVLQNILKTNNQIPLNIVDIVGRSTIGKTSYEEAWKGDELIEFQTGFCTDCEFNQKCPIITTCPTDCFTVGKGIDYTKCFNCGTCVPLCPYHAFKGELGTITLKEKSIPITLRQSDRVGAEKLMHLLKKQIKQQKFTLKERIDEIQHL